MGEDQTIGDKFTPEARAELLAMYTGMAMQGLIAAGRTNFGNVGNDAVNLADATITALEKFHADRAKLEAANVSAAQ